MREIVLKNGMVALVDDADYDRISVHNWLAIEGRRGSWYAQRQWDAIMPDGKRKHFVREMQRDVLDPDMTAPRALLSDHINHDTLDNRRNNLRWADAHVSMLNRRLFKNNTSGYRGVYTNQTTGRFRAVLTNHRVRYISQYYATPEDAARAYNELAVRHHGEHAQLNVIPEKT